MLMPMQHAAFSKDSRDYWAAQEHFVCATISGANYQTCSFLSRFACACVMCKEYSIRFMDLYRSRYRLLLILQSTVRSRLWMTYRATEMTAILFLNQT